MNAATLLKKFDDFNANLSQRWGIHLLRYSLAIIYIWFGILKPFGVSPASNLVEHTVVWFSHDWFVPALGVWEVLIGLALLFRPTVRFAVLMIYFHLPCTFLPFFIFPESAMAQPIFELTLVGQYIIKNLTLLVAAIVIGGSLKQSETQKKTIPYSRPEKRKNQALQREELTLG
ncbi:MAG: hypothetical protein R2788_21555 [Saprospiraceae bacterium]